MSKTIIWRKGILYENNNPVGRILKTEDDRTAYAINDVKLKFDATGYLTKNTTIRGNGNEPLGEIIKKKWSNKATIQLKNGTQYELKKPNVFSKNWNLTANGNPIMDFQFSLSKGKVNYLFEDEILLLCSLYIINNN